MNVGIVWNRTIRIMKKAITCFILLLIATGCEQTNDIKTIEISKETVSSIYPAMWFSPSTGEVTTITTLSEIPPKSEFECWIEPQDPEFAFLDNAGIFLYVGIGENSFTAPLYNENADNNRALNELMDTIDPDSFPIFYVKSFQSKTRCFIQIITWDTDSEVIRFRWRLATKREISEFS